MIKERHRPAPDIRFPQRGREGLQGRDHQAGGTAGGERTVAARRQEQVTLRIDRDVLDFFRGDGPGWQERIDAALRKAAGK